MFDLLLGGAKIRLRVIIHGPVVECLSGIKVVSASRTLDGVACDLEIDGLGMLIKIANLLVQAEVVDVNVTAA